MLEDKFAKIFANMDGFKNKILDLSMAKYILLFIIILFSLSAAHFLLYMHGFVSIGAGDTFIMDHALYNTVKGKGIMAVGGIEHYPDYFNTSEIYPYSQFNNYYEGHKKIILLLILPIYYLWPSLFNLLLLQCLMLGLAAFPLYKICNHFLQEKTSKIIAISYLLYPAVILNGIAGFHVTLFSPLFIFLMFYFYINKKPHLHILSLILLLTLFENMFLVSIPIAFYYIFDTFFNKESQKTRLFKYSLPTFVLTFVYYGIFLYYIIEPIFSPDTSFMRSNSFSYHFGYLGHSIPEIIMNSILHPTLVINIHHAMKFITYVFVMLFPLAFIPLSKKKSIIALLMSSLIVLESILSQEPTMEAIYTRFQVVVVPFLFLSMIISISEFQKEGNKCLTNFNKHFIYYAFFISVLYSFWYVLSYLLGTRIYT